MYGTKNVSDQKHDFHLTNWNEVDINDLVKTREAYFKILISGNLNINSNRSMTISLRDVVAKVLIDILCIDKTELDDSFPDSQFLIEYHQFPSFRRDRNSKGGVKIVYVRQGLISKRLENFQSKTIETICIEFSISKKK